MTPEQEEHLQDIISQTTTMMERKYRAGQAEHGGNLADMSKYKLLDCALEEAIDQVVYLLTLRANLNK